MVCWGRPLRSLITPSSPSLNHKSDLDHKVCKEIFTRNYCANQQALVSPQTSRLINWTSNSQQIIGDEKLLLGNRSTSRRQQPDLARHYIWRQRRASTTCLTRYGIQVRQLAPQIDAFAAACNRHGHRGGRRWRNADRDLVTPIRDSGRLLDEGGTTAQQFRSTG